MIDRILHFSIQNRLLMVVFGIMLVGFGINAALKLPIDAVPDVTTVQVQINTVAPALAPEEMERLVTFPLEISLSGLPRVQEIRSISQFGLSQVTAIFEDGTDIYFARQLVLERLQDAMQHLPEGVGHPEMAPISTGLGEIYYVIVEKEPNGSEASKAYEAYEELRTTVVPMSSPSDPSDPSAHNLMELRTLLEWDIAPQLRTVPGIIEVNRVGGLEKQYQVLVDPAKLVSHDLTLRQVFEALERNNRNAGGAYLRRGGEQELVRGVGLVRSVRDIENIIVATDHGTPIYVRDVAQVVEGPAIRQGAVTKDGQGEAVVGIAMLLMGENSRTVVRRVKEKVVQIEKQLKPLGVKLTPFLDRTELVNKTIRTAFTNLTEGGLLVIVILFLLLLQLRAGLIVSSAIPLSMLFAIIGMNYFGISANLMSLGAIDFGLIVDAAVIIVENCVRRLAEKRKELGRPLTPQERLHTIYEGSVEVRRASQFGEMIIIAAYLPILTLGGIEGKMFKPMAFTVVFALSGALVLSLTLIPALCALFLREPKGEGENPFIEWLKRRYEPLLRQAMRHRLITVGGAALFFAGCAALFPLLGAEFLPELDEGALAIQAQALPSMSVEEAVNRSTQIERLLKAKFSNEIGMVVTRIGRAEIATDPMLVSQWDMMVSLKPKSKWKVAKTREELVGKMAEELERFPGFVFSFTQPIKMRMIELIEGSMFRADVGIKLFGEDLDVLREKANEIARVVSTVRGAVDIGVEQISGLPVLEIRIKRDEIARYGINVADVQEVIETAIGGKEATEVIEGNRRFDLVLRFAPSAREEPEAISNILVSTPNGQRVPLSQLAEIVHTEGPVQIQRENGQRRILIQVNVRGRDMGSVVEEARRKVEQQVKLPPGYYIEWGGMYEHLQSGRARLMVVVPATFFIIFLLLFTTFNSLKQAALVFTGIPFAITGGILSLLFRGMHFSMSAGVGFIALFGVAVLNGVVMVTFINQLREQGMGVMEAVIEGAKTRLRPVLMTALVASLGFVPMAISTGTGAEVQKPLATVVIGGLITSTVLTLFVLPTLYAWFEGRVADKLDQS